MKTKIKEVQNYFKSAILEGRYEVKDCDPSYITVLIDGEYKFNLWIYMDGVDFKLFSTAFIQLEFNDAEKAIGYKTVMDKLTPVLNQKMELELERDKIDEKIKALSL